jgi:hypothetical protein
MTNAPKPDAKYEIIEHSMSRITMMGVGNFDEFQQRFESTMPASAPQDVMAQVKTWQQGLDLIEAKAPFGLLIYRVEART